MEQIIGLRMRVKEELSNLKENDIYSLMMFVLFKVKDIPEYSSISELAFILDKDNLLKLCEYYGGLTIKIPTISELESVLDALLMYQLIDVQGNAYSDAVKILGSSSSELRVLKQNYLKVREVMKDYDFVSRTI